MITIPGKIKQIKTRLDFPLIELGNIIETGFNKLNFEALEGQIMFHSYFEKNADSPLTNRYFIIVNKNTILNLRDREGNKPIPQPPTSESSYFYNYLGNLLLLNENKGNFFILSYLLDNNPRFKNTNQDIMNYGAKLAKDQLYLLLLDSGLKTRRPYDFYKNIKVEKLPLFNDLYVTPVKWLDTKYTL